MLRDEQCLKHITNSTYAITENSRKTKVNVQITKQSLDNIIWQNKAKYMLRYEQCLKHITNSTIHWRLYKSAYTLFALVQKVIANIDYAYFWVIDATCSRMPDNGYLVQRTAEIRTATKHVCSISTAVITGAEMAHCEHSLFFSWFCDSKPSCSQTMNSISWPYLHRSH